MNIMSVLNQIMNQAGTMQSNQPQQTPSSSGGGIDMKSLVGGGALGLLLGSKRGRKMGKKALKYGAVAGVGALAWKAYQNYQSNSQQAAAPSSSVEQQGQQLDQLVGVPQEQRGLQILQAMIMAARADGHIDGKERELLSQEIAKLQPDDELHAWIQQQFDAPLDPSVFARTVDCPQGKREIYLVSAAIIDDQNPMERAWLDQLASALELDPVITRELERQLLAM